MRAGALGLTCTLVGGRVLGRELCTKDSGSTEEGAIPSEGSRWRGEIWESFLEKGMFELLLFSQH